MRYIRSAAALLGYLLGCAILCAREPTRADNAPSETIASVNKISQEIGPPVLVPPKKMQTYTLSQMGPHLQIHLQKPDDFKSVSEAFREGIRDYNAGNKGEAVKALQFAALQGHTVSLWKLGRMFAEGDGVEHDDLKAFEYFSQIADRYAEENPDTKQAPFIASAFVALGGYFLQGIPGSYVKADVNRAVDMFQYAASYYGDPDGQYALARLYLEGQGVPKDARQAARWLKLAAEKGHQRAQALLGNMLVLGEGVSKQPALGLMWLALARDAIDCNKEKWIKELYDKSFAAASDTERRQALSYLERYLRSKG